jgi:hypothetical protein
MNVRTAGGTFAYVTGTTTRCSPAPGLLTPWKEETTGERRGGEGEYLMRLEDELINSAAPSLSNSE